MVLAIRQKLSLSSLAQFLIEAGLMLIMIAAGLLHLS
jgi:high-affinity Fe2+/Pb2+ permease